MRLYLDGMFYRCSGVGRVFENLLSGFSEDEGLREIRTAVPAALRGPFLEQFPSPKVRPAFLPYGPMGFGDLFRKGKVLREMGKEVDLFLFPGHNVPLSALARYVVSVNDVTVFSPHFEAPRHRKAGFRWLLGRAVRGAQKVVTISETVKRDLVREFSLPPEKVIVIYPWVKDLFFRPIAGEGEAAPPPVDGDYILFVGLRIAHKNLEGLIRAFLLISEDFPGLKLAIAGTRYAAPDMVDRWKTDPQIAGRLVEILDPPDETLARLYSGAKVFVFPSFAEGFGLPPLEAMACGVPVVCSDIPVFREVYGDAVRYADPSRPDSIAEGVRAVLTVNAVRGGLVERGRNRAALYRRSGGIERYLRCLRP